ncbi:hypothetical protein KY343_01385, partial [Candidatus Woesearchaeota archaeon]|nr:hypothetical protein [Candidatus Woesearchaeota archaeon]
MPNDERERKLAERLARFRKKESGESDGEAEAALARDNEELRLRLTEAMKELESAQVVKEDLERRFKILEGGEEDELRKELESLRADISKQMNELSEMRKSGDEKARLERKNEELEEKLQTQREVIEAAQQGINELEATNRQYEEELQALRQERDSLAVEAEVARELKGEIERASELEEKLQTQREVIEAAKQGLNELEAERNSAVAECKQIKEQFALKEALLKQLFNEDEERRKIKKRNEQLESEVRRLTTGRKGPKADEDNFVIGKEDRVKGYITENGFVFPAHKIPIERIVYDREKELVIVVEGGNDSYFILRRNITEILACHDSKFKGEEYNRFNFTNKLTDHVIAIEREVRPGSDAFVEDLKQKIQKAFKPGFEQDK